MEPESTGTLDSWKSMGISVNQCHMANGAFPINLQVGVFLQKCLKLKVQVSFRTWFFQSSGGDVRLETRLAQPPKNWKKQHIHLKSPMKSRVDIQFSTLFADKLSIICGKIRPNATLPNPQDLLQDWGTFERSVFWGFFGMAKVERIESWWCINYRL